MGNFDQLPSDVVLDIITRLPTDSVLDCKLVCKPWKKLVSHHPSFIQLHSNRLLNHSSESAGELSFLFFDSFGQLYYLKYDDEHDDTPPVRTFRRVNLTTPYRSGEYKVVGSFNGLVCLYGWEDYHFYCICNPVTKEYVVLPKIERDYKVGKCSSGFCYLPISNEYKVVQLMARKEYRFLELVVSTEVVVYTLGSGAGWRNVGRLDYESRHMYEQTRVYAELGVFVNGVLHWAHVKGGKVLTLDLAEEKLGYLSPPPSPLDDSKWFTYSVGILSGVLYYVISWPTGVSSETGSTYCNIWLLKNKGDIRDTEGLADQEPLGWSKEFSLPQRELLALTKSGGILCFGYTSLDIYDPVSYLG